MRSLIPVIPYLLESDTSNELFFALRSVEKYYPLHGHDYYELELATGGSGRQWINNVCMPVQKGSLYLLTPADIHRVEADTTLKYISIHFMPQIAARMDFAQLRQAHSMQLTCADYELYLHLFLSVLRERNKRPPYFDHRIFSITMLTMAHLMRYGTSLTPAASSRHIQRALKYIHENHNNPALRLKDVAEECGLSASHFSATFHSLVGRGFAKYLQGYRLQRACTLLSDLDISVTEAAYEAGFTSLPHFFRIFREAYQCTPREYCQSIKRRG